MLIILNLDKLAFWKYSEHRFMAAWHNGYPKFETWDIPFVPSHVPARRLSCRLLFLGPLSMDPVLIHTWSRHDIGRTREPYYGSKFIEHPIPEIKNLILFYFRVKVTSRVMTFPQGRFKVGLASQTLRTHWNDVCYIFVLLYVFQLYRVLHTTVQ